MNNLTLHLNGPRKRTTNKTQVIRRKEIFKIRAVINKIESKKIQKISETKSQVFEKIKKIVTPVTRPIKEKRERTQINKIRNERGEVTTDNREVQKIVKKIYYEEL